jgi:hypothetical protein
VFSEVRCAACMVRLRWLGGKECTTTWMMKPEPATTMRLGSASWRRGVGTRRIDAEAIWPDCSTDPCRGSRPRSCGY